MSTVFSHDLEQKINAKIKGMYIVGPKIRTIVDKE
jgi:hypothetical protein